MWGFFRIFVKKRGFKKEVMYERKKVRAFEEKRKDYFDESMKICNEIEEVYFFQDLIAYLGISFNHFRELFPVGSEWDNALRAAIFRNKVKKKIELRKKWGSPENKNAATEIYLYKLLSTAEERMLTAPQFIDVKQDADDIINMSEEDIDAEIQKLEDSFKNGAS